MTGGPWYWAEVAATLVCHAWIFTGVLIKVHAAGRTARAVFHELKPFFWPAALLGYLCEIVRFGKPFDPFNLVAMGTCVLAWFMLRNADDDRWKRRRRQVAEKVAQVAGRLTVVPAGAET